MISDPETYLSWTDDGVVLLCEREECMVRSLFGGVWQQRQWLQIELPFKCLPEEAVLIRAKHVATHTDDAPQPGDMRVGAGNQPEMFVRNNWTH